MISKHITHQYDGNIDFESELGVGTVFTFKLKLQTKTEDGPIGSLNINQIANQNGNRTSGLHSRFKYEWVPRTFSRNFLYV
jgi:hypothetical protein